MQTYLTTCAAFMSQGQEAPRYLTAYSCVVEVLTTLPFSITAIGLSELNTCAANFVMAGAKQNRLLTVPVTRLIAQCQLAGPADVIWKLVAHVYWVIRLAGRELRRLPSRHRCARGRSCARHVGCPQPGACVASEREVYACVVCANPCDLFLRECVIASVSTSSSSDCIAASSPSLVHNVHMQGHRALHTRHGRRAGCMQRRQALRPGER